MPCPDFDTEIVRRPPVLVRLAVVASCAVTSAFSQQDLVETRRSGSDEGNFQWGAALRQSLGFMALEHGFRVATESDTRAGLKGPFVRDYFRSITALHGWGDGDPFLINYVGHPFQGAVSGFIQVQNDPRFRAEEFGASTRYWQSRLRALGWAAAYSTEFELGPISEASIGNVSLTPGHAGVVDLVVTPVGGFAVMLAEDALDATSAPAPSDAGLSESEPVARQYAEREGSVEARYAAGCDGALNLAEQPACRVFLQLFVFRIPEIHEQVARGQVADPSFAVIVSPAGGRRGAEVSERLAILVHALQQKVLRILLIRHEVLFVGDHKVFDAPRDGVVGIHDFHFERADGRVLLRNGAENVAKVVVMRADIGDIVIEKHAAACLHEVFHRFALGGRYPVVRLATPFGKRRITDDLRGREMGEGGVAALVRVAIGPRHTVAEDDEEFVIPERFRGQQVDFITKIDGEAEFFAEGFAQTHADVVAVVIAVADQSEGGGFRRCLVGGEGERG